MRRTLNQVRANACRIRRELEHLAQPSSSDYDMVVLLEALEEKERDLATAKRRYDELAVLNGGTPIYGSLPISKSE